jgi:hypothetical protein
MLGGSMLFEELFPIWSDKYALVLPSKGEILVFARSRGGKTGLEVCGGLL